MTIDEALKSLMPDAGSANMVRKAVQSQRAVAASIAHGHKVSADFRSQLSVIKAVHTIAGKRANVTVSRGATAAPMDFSHLIPAPTRSAEAAVATTGAAPFAERMMAAVAIVDGKAFDANKLVTGPVQRSRVASGNDILAAHRAVTGAAQ